MTKIISISLTDEEKEYLDEINASPTQLMKMKIMESMTSSIAQRKKIKMLEEELDKVSEISVKRLEFINDNGLGAKYNGFIMKSFGYSNTETKKQDGIN